MTDFEKSRKFWEKAIASIEVTMFIMAGFFFYFIVKMLTKFDFDSGTGTLLILQIIFAGFIIYLNKSFMDELNRRLPIPKHNHVEE